MECAETPWFPQHYAACGDHAVWLFQRTVRRLCSGRKCIFLSGAWAAASAAGMASDVPLLLGITLFSALFVFVGNMLANIIYGIVDPQIREGYGHE